MTEKSSDLSHTKKIVNIVDTSGKYVDRRDKVIASVTVNGDAAAFHTACVSAWGVVAQLHPKGLHQCVVERGDQRSTLAIPIDFQTFKDHVARVAHASSTTGN